MTRGHGQRGAALVETLIILPIFLLMVLGVMQSALVFYAKSNVNYATFEAARAGTVHGADKTAINLAFQRAMMPYYGGGTTNGELIATLGRIGLDAALVRIEILSPTPESFIDYNSPALQAQLHVTQRVIPNSALDELTCPRDVAGCAANPATNHSGQTLLDANLLKLRVTYGIPAHKQMPLVGKFYTWALQQTNAAGSDTFKQGLIAAGAIPVVTSTVMRMQSDAIENDAMVSSPGKGNGGKPVDPGPPDSSPDLPNCPFWELECAPHPCVGPSCSPETCGG